MTFDVPDTLPLARFDAGLLDQALSNLLENVGSSYAAGHAGVDHRAHRGRRRATGSERRGSGHPAGARERVFGKFQRLADGGFGTGLGLAIARAATEAQGGQLRIEDSPLGGARFVLVIPDAVAVEADDAR